MLSTKSYVDPTVMTLFTEKDKVAKPVWLSESGEIMSTRPNSTDTADELTQVGYSAPKKAVIDRLNVMGFTIEAARSLFEDGIQDKLSELKEYEGNSEIETLYAKEIALYSDLSFESWLAAFQEIKSKGLQTWDLSPHREGAVKCVLSDLATFVLSSNDDEPLFRFPTSDVRYFLRAALEASNIDAVLFLDLTEVVGSGYYSIEDRVSEMARAELSSDYPTNSRIVVLTEGSSDSRVLKATMELFFPHLAEYYSFMDFHAPNAPGGAGQLVNTIKSFAGAGISNRVIAVFDNDTAARAALRALARIALPSFMRVLQFPALPSAASYPTIGPSGLVQMDVNGLAGSLELYFGEDVLKREDGSLTPVHWRGYDAAVCAYQGELTEKAQLQERFDLKLAAAASTPTLIKSQDWTPMRSVLDAIRCAFDA
ncbi:MAG: hypothetical protein K8R23_16750 [Chthoniobacter sp.]|nr:hypothetical protein [Chthoniobacter sp.]